MPVRRPRRVQRQATRNYFIVENRAAQCASSTRCPRDLSVKSQHPELPARWQLMLREFEPATIRD